LRVVGLYSNEKHERLKHYSASMDLLPSTGFR
jgi:hypothetical protein